MTPSPVNKCLVVLGMHRSGTSSLTGALHFTGFDLGKSIMPPADENPKGFFENTEFVNLNDKILDELYNFWDDTIFIPEGWWESGFFDPYRNQVTELMHKEFTAGMPILLKDPRLSILLPLYLKVFEQLGIEPAFLICVRNPLEVASSLKRRNNISQEKSFMLWMDYQLKAELYSRNYPRLFISNANFLQKPIVALNRMEEALQLGMDLEGKREDILAFLDPSLTQRLLKDEMPEIRQLPGLAKLYKLQAVADCRDFSMDELFDTDQVRAQFYASARFFNGLPEKYEAALTVMYANGKKSVIYEPVAYGENQLNFQIDPTILVKSAVLRPCNSRVGVRFINIEAEFGDSTNRKIEKFESNGSKNARGMHLFDTDLPMVRIDFHHPAILSGIRFHLFYHVFGIISSRKAFWRP